MYVRVTNHYLFVPYSSMRVCHDTRCVTGTYTAVLGVLVYIIVRSPGLACLMMGIYNNQKDLYSKDFCYYIARTFVTI